MQTDELKRQAEYAQRLAAVRVARETAAAEAAALAETRRQANLASIAQHKAAAEAEHARGIAELQQRQELRLKARALAAWQRGGGVTADFETAWPGLREDAQRAMTLAELTHSAPQRRVVTL